MSQLSVLVVVEHDNQTIKSSTYNSITAAREIIAQGGVCMSSWLEAK